VCEDDEFSVGAKCFLCSWCWRPKVLINGAGEYFGISRGTIHLGRDFQGFGEIPRLLEANSAILTKVWSFAGESPY
jgi:hypothetical protein